jgi:hypothetical protein
MLSASESVNCTALPWTLGDGRPELAGGDLPHGVPAPVLSRLKPNEVVAERSTSANRTWSRIWGSAAGTSTRNRLTTFAQRGRHAGGALGARKVFHRAPQKNRVVGEVEADVLASSARRSCPWTAWMRAIFGRTVRSYIVRTPSCCHRISEVSPGRFAVDQHLPRIHRQGLGEVAVGHRDAAQVGGSIQKDRLAHGDHQIHGVTVVGAYAGSATDSRDATSQQPCRVMA